MKIKDHLDKATTTELNKIKDKPVKRKRKKKKSNGEQLTQRDLKELMGMNRDRYERRGGDMRGK